MLKPMQSDNGVLRLKIVDNFKKNIDPEITLRLAGTLLSMGKKPMMSQDQDPAF